MTAGVLLGLLVLASGSAYATDPGAPSEARRAGSGVLGAEGGPPPSATPPPVVPDADAMTPLRVEPAAARVDSLPTEAEKVPRGVCGIADLGGVGREAGPAQRHGDTEERQPAPMRGLLAPASPRCAEGYLRWVERLRADTQGAAAPDGATAPTPPGLPTGVSGPVGHVPGEALRRGQAPPPPQEADAADATTPPTHPEPAYRFEAEIHRDLAGLVAEQPGLVTPFVVGSTVRGRPIWGFRVLQPGVAVRQTLLVIANLHSMEWVPSEIAADFVRELALHPPPGVSTIVVPSMNPDGRARVEMDLRRGDNRFRRGNANNVDLNRDFAELRDGPTPFRWMMPWRYGGTPGPLSQPESRALDALADAGRFDAAVSLHAFGGYLFYPYAGAWERPPDHAALHRLAVTMQAGMGNGAYQPRQLSRYFFAFVGQGMEIDHLYRRYGTRAVLVETTHSGLSPFRPGEWGTHFRWYNPRDPRPHVQDNLGALRALAWSLAFDNP